MPFSPERVAQRSPTPVWVARSPSPFSSERLAQRSPTPFPGNISGEGQVRSPTPLNGNLPGSPALAPPTIPTPADLDRLWGFLKDWRAELGIFSDD